MSTFPPLNSNLIWFNGKLSKWKIKIGTQRCSLDQYLGDRTEVNYSDNKNRCKMYYKSTRLLEICNVYCNTSFNWTYNSLAYIGYVPFYTKQNDVVDKRCLSFCACKKTSLFWQVYIKKLFKYFRNVFKYKR